MTKTNETPAVRCRRGDYVKYPDMSSRIGQWVVGCITDRNGDSVMVETRIGDTQPMAKSDLYKATKAEYEAWGAESIGISDDIEIDDEEIDVRLNPNHERYTRHVTTTASGRACYDISDYVASVLRGLNMEDTYHAVSIYLSQCGEPKTIAELEAKYTHLNAGMQRMNLGNLLRGAMKRNGIEELDINATYEEI